ncbi:hypothetical protein DL96DRAFT_1702014 [Flagelloscypha sp. PMI_526]|nr:hypothetical protein DL96DRAFT_1702014 [Flagelloscypha sp. PMI_526]
MSNLKPRREIPPIAPRWHPTSNPDDIHVPGLDNTAPVHDQIEQIEQLITIKLQNIDENFAKIQHTLQNKILPAVKRYSVATEPVREAAKFWVSFYEQAAQIQIPSADDWGNAGDQPSETTQQRSEDTMQESHGREDTVTEDPEEASNQTTSPETRQDIDSSTESSFARDALSSTPATTRLAVDSFSTDPESHPSFASTIESPLERLDRNFRDFAMEGTPMADSGALDETLKSNRADRTATVATNSTRRPAKDETPLRTVLKRNLYTAQDVAVMGALALSPNKIKPHKGPITKERNPYLSPGTNPKDWTGVVDLRDRSVLSPAKGKGKSRARTPVKAAPVPDDDDDDEWDGLPPGMSPPKFMSPARPLRSVAEQNTILGRTPSRDLVSRLTKGAVGAVQKEQDRRSAYAPLLDASSSTLPSIPSMSKYHAGETSGSMAYDSTIESLMRRVDGMISATPRFQHDTNSSSSRSAGGLHSLPSSSRYPESPGVPRLSPRDLVAFPDDPVTPAPRLPSPDPNFQTPGQYDAFDDSWDEDKEVFDTRHPSAAFLMASMKKPGINDESFSSSEDSLDAEQRELDPGEINPHPFARFGQNMGSDDGWGDSDDEDMAEPADEPSETLFGIKEGRAASAEALRKFGSALDDTEGFTGQNVISPTPAGPSRFSAQ